MLITLLVCFALGYGFLNITAGAQEPLQIAKTLSLLPGNFSVDEADQSGFSSPENVVITDLGSEAVLGEFSVANSAVLLVGNQVKLQVEPVNEQVNTFDDAVIPKSSVAPEVQSAETSPADVAALDEVSTVPAVMENTQVVEPVTPEKTPEISPETDEATIIVGDSKKSGTDVDLVEHSLILKDFAVSGDMVGVITNAQLRLSLGGRQLGSRDQIKVSYKTATEWQEAGVMDFKNELSGSVNKGYYLFALPIFAGWSDFANLEVKIAFIGDQANSAAELYIDGAWLEVDYSQAEAQAELLAAPVEEEQAATTDFEMNLISPDTNFKTTDNPDFNFVYKRKHKGVKGFMQSLLGVVVDEYSDLKIKTKLKNSLGEVSDLGVTIDYLANGEFKVRVDKNKRNFKPGKYRLAIEIEDGEVVNTQYQDFSWGVLAINTSKSIYLPTETAYLQMGVLTETGDTICDAEVFLEITAPDGGVAYLDTTNGLVIREAQCGPNNVIDVPDYYARYGLAGVGAYKIKMTARTKNGDRVINDQFEVREAVPFEIERLGPTRIWPLANYTMKMIVKANDMANDFYEVVPKNFMIVKSRLKLNGTELIFSKDYDYEVYSDGTDGQVLRWSGFKIKPNDFLEIDYEFDAPDISPEFYFLGPAKVGGWQEVRMWQLASDEVILNVNSGTSVGAWTTPAQSWDGSNNLRAVRTAVNGATDYPTAYLKARPSQVDNLGGVITKVEIGFEALVSSALLDAGIRPLFNGTATGTQVVETGMTTSDVVRYYDITADVAGPGVANWTWNNVSNLEVLIYGVNGNGARTLSVDQVYIRVTGTGKPINYLNFVTQKTDGSGTVDFSAQVADIDGQNLKAKVEYVANSNCNFATPQDPTLLLTGTSSTYGTFGVNNAFVYQLGSTTATSSAIYTASGTNTINFDWDSKTDLSNADGVYCVRFTAADASGDATSTTATTTIDNVKPTAPSLSALATTSLGNQVQLTFDATSSDTNFKEYKIYYKVGTSSVTEADSVLTQADDSNLVSGSLNGATSTLISDLLSNTTYSFVIFAYDYYGNKASSSQGTIDTGKAKPSRANTVQFMGGIETGDGTTGKNTNTDLTLSAFNFSLAETGAVIQNAYVVAEISFRSYTTASTSNFTGYKLNFDACEKNPTCTPNAFTGSGAGFTAKDDSTILAYHETTAGMNNIRLMLDVTSEPEILAYRGGGKVLSGQVGYHIKRNGVENSISAAKAMLYVTYKYQDKYPESLTNTVIYPLESTDATPTPDDSGSKQAMQAISCNASINACPKFNYNMAIPEFKSMLSQWFQTYNANDMTAVATDLTIDMNIEGTDANSSPAYVQENMLANGEGTVPVVYTANVAGFTENTAQTLEYHGVGGNTGYYLLGGEVVETYTASTSATTKTRTVSYPLGVISNGLSAAKNNGNVNVYFPENGMATGSVTIKKAWFRIIPNHYLSAANTFTVSSKMGANAESAAYGYTYNPAAVVVKPSFNIIHVIPAADYTELAKANASVPVNVILYTTNSLNTTGGNSAELMITYAYTSETQGHLSSLNVFGGQTSGVSVATTTSGITLALPEPPGSKTMRAGALLSHMLISDSAFAVSNVNITSDVNVSTGTPVCTVSYNSHADTANYNFEYYKSVTSALSVEDGEVLNACFAKDNTRASMGLKGSAQLLYTYQWDAPAVLYSQYDWRWYENLDSVDPVLAKNSTNSAISNINIGDVIRLRLNAGSILENLPTSSAAFKLQYGATSSNCATIASAAWFDLGTSTQLTAWRSYNNPSVVDGATNGSMLLGTSNKFESYEENNPSTYNPLPIAENEKAEWDWTVYNYSASSTQNYCFRMLLSNGTVFSEYTDYPYLLTAASNTAPINPFSLLQFKNSTTTSIVNDGWTNETSVKFNASTTDVNGSSTLRFFFNFATSTALLTATTVPAGTICSYGAAWNSCVSKVWRATSTSGDYRTTPFGTTTLITGLPDNYSSTSSYKWQVLACDNGNLCSDWSTFGAAPNFKVDATAPTVPGWLRYFSKTPTSLTLQLGTTSTETNFSEYVIYYKKATSSVKETDIAWSSSSDANLVSRTFAGATSTTIINLSANSTYVFNIWAYDIAGNKASSTIELVASTSNSFTEPVSTLISAGQVTNGSGAVNLVFTADDADNDDTLRAKIQYEAGVGCLFTSSTSAIMDTSDASTVANYGDPKIDNSLAYQVGSSTGWILTSFGQNGVDTQWQSASNLPNTEGWYCVRLTVNDGVAAGDHDQLTPSTRTVFIDNIKPATPGDLSSPTAGNTSIVVKYGTTSSDNQFNRYRMYYSTTSPVTEADLEWSDADFLAANFLGGTSTTITGLKASTTYYIKLWAYDVAGNKASTSILTVTTDKVPANASAYGQYFSNGLTNITNGGWTNEGQVRLVASSTDPDSSESLSLYIQLVANASSFTTATITPASFCTTSVAFASCASKIWLIGTSTTGDYRVTPFVATGTISVADSATGYKWQALACDSKNVCSNNWTVYNAVTPNFKVDTLLPTAPGALTYNAKSSVSVTLSFGSSTTEANFSQYRIFYSTSSPVMATGSEQIDANLNFINYDGSSLTTIESLQPSTQYYFNIWAVDLAGNMASSTEVAVTTSAMQSTPGVAFYTKNTSVLYYKVWSPTTGWSAEQVGPTMGSTTGDFIRHIEVRSSDDRGKVAIVAKTWNATTTTQQWWGTVYKVAANTFATSSQLGASYASANGANQITACIASLSSGQFFVVHNNNGANNYLLYTWNATSGWSTGAIGVSPGATTWGGCKLIRRPNSDNYLMMTYYGGAAPRVGSAYYYGGATYIDTWLPHIAQSTANESSIDNYVGDAFFDPSDNTRGALDYTNSNATTYVYGNRFTVTDTTFSDGLASTSPTTAPWNWGTDVVHGEFAIDTALAGQAYYAGRDTGGQLNVIRLDISNSTPTWSTTTNGDNVSLGGLYAHTNLSQKPFDLEFYKDNGGVLAWASSSSSTPQYRKLNTLTNTLDANNIAIVGAAPSSYTRVNLQRDPNEIQLLALYQSTSTINYYAVFFDGANNQFFTSGNQGWTSLATNTRAFDGDDAAVAFSYTAPNSAPNTPTNPLQLRSDASTTIVNGNWTNEASVNFRLSMTDPDTSETLKYYLQVIDNASNFNSSSTEPTNACSMTATYTTCVGKIWRVATSSPGDYSVTPFTASGTVLNIPDSALGYKWQVMSCDAAGLCSNWVKFNVTQPNFKVDATAPNPAPGNLTIASRNSNSITLQLGATTSEVNFSTYRIYYKATTSGVTEADSLWLPASLGFINYNGATSTTVTGLASSTNYVFRIWAYDLAGNKSSSIGEVSTSTAARPIVYQTSFIFENDDGTTVNNNSTSTNASTTITNVLRGERLNARIQLENRGGDVMTNKTFKLQYMNLTDGGNWYDVDQANISGIFAIHSSWALSGSSGDVVTSMKASANANASTSGRFYENTIQTGSLSLNNGAYTEVVFSVRTATTAVLNKIYALRLYNVTDNAVLDGYLNYSTMGIVATDTRRLSKSAQASLPTGIYDLTYFLDHKGYADVLTNNDVRDSATSSNAYAVYNFSTFTATNSKSITGTWEGQSSVSASSKYLQLQVYRFGTTNAWENVATDTAVVANLDTTLSGTVNAKLSQYYDVNNWTYWRVYQDFGSENLRTDMATTTFSTSTPSVSMIHYRWRYDDGNQANATWYEAEDTGSTTNKMQKIRLRTSVVDTKAGPAINYRYKLEYATTSSNCESDPGGWLAVSTSTDLAFRATTSSNYTDQSVTTAQLANTEGYGFTAGWIVEHPSNSATSTTLTEERYTEDEYAIYATNNAVDGTTYCFRVTNNGVALDGYDNLAELTIAGSTNSGPTFSAVTADGSDTVSPTNYGSDVLFSATADDPELDNYYLAVCKTNNIAAGNGAPPTCPGGNWCISTEASSSNEASCAYTTATTSEQLNWYSFACDKKNGSGIAKCSPMSNSGNGDVTDDSPFNVNHLPIFTSVATVVDNPIPGPLTTQAGPGSTYRISTVSQDTDVVGGADTLTLYVCKAVGATVAGCNGVGNELCSTVGTSSPNAKCTFTTSAPLAAGNTNYYAYLFDSHDLAASANGSRNSTYNTWNVPPNFSTLVFNSGSDITLNLKPADKVVTAVASSVVDVNGCSDFSVLTSTIYMSTTTGGYSCALDNSFCYNPVCAITNCSGGVTADVTCTSSLKYYTAPTDNASANNPYRDANWLAYIQLLDNGGNMPAATSSGVEVIMSEGLLVYQQQTGTIQEALIDFGNNMLSGQDTGATNKVINVANIGNSPIDGDMYGDDMNGNPSGTLAATWMKWSLSNFTYGSGGTALSNNSGAPNSVSLNIPRATSTATSSRAIYWGIKIPIGTQSSAFTGLNYLYSKLYDLGGW